MTALLAAQGASVTRGRFHLADVSLEVRVGEAIAVTGPNGAGKSTLLKLLAGLLRPQAGAVRWRGMDLAGLPPRDRARRIAWAPQEPVIPDGVPLLDYVALGGYARKDGPAAHRDVLKLLKDFDLQDHASQSVDRLSGGEKRRALLARGLAQGAEVLLWDEPTAHLDPRHQAGVLEVLATVRARGVAALLVMHDLRAARAACPRMLLLEEGRVRHDGPWDRLSPALLQDVYGLPLSI